MRVAGALGRAGDLKPDLAIDADVALDDLARVRRAAHGGTRSRGGPAEGASATTSPSTPRSKATTCRSPAGPSITSKGRSSRPRARRRRRGPTSRLRCWAAARPRKGTWQGGEVDAKVNLQSIRTARLRREGVDLGIPFDGIVSGDDRRPRPDRCAARGRRPHRRRHRRRPEGEGRPRRLGARERHRSRRRPPLHADPRRGRRRRSAAADRRRPRASRAARRGARSRPRSTAPTKARWSWPRPRARRRSRSPAASATPAARRRSPPPRARWAARSTPSGEARGSVIRRLDATGTSIDLAPAARGRRRPAPVPAECLGRAGPPDRIREPRRRRPHVEGGARRPGQRAGHGHRGIGARGAHRSPSFARAARAPSTARRCGPRCASTRRRSRRWPRSARPRIR